MNIKKILNIIILNYVLIYLHPNNSTITCKFEIVSLNNFLTRNPESTYIHVNDEIFFNYKPFELSINQEGHPNNGYFAKNFILKIPNATIIGTNGFCFYKNQFIFDLIWKEASGFLYNIKPISHKNLKYINNKVATISLHPYFNYWHWISEVLCRLALLELYNIDYDYLYVPQSSSFMQETLKLWGIPQEKIIAPTSDNFCIQAEEVIIPSMVSNMNFKPVQFACYTQLHLINYVKNKLLHSAKLIGPSQSFSKKVFISRKDTKIRQILNEDELFSIFEKQGFIRYELAKLSVIDQIFLFNQAEIIVSPQGTGLANIIFCNKKVEIIELFQRLNDATFWYLTQDLGLNYTAIQTTDFSHDYIDAWQSNCSIPKEFLKEVETFIDNKFN